jgi:hypothetical protein
MKKNAKKYALLEVIQFSFLKVRMIILAVPVLSSFFFLVGM